MQELAVKLQVMLSISEQMQVIYGSLWALLSEIKRLIDWLNEAVIREATDNMETGISVGGRRTNTIRYADDTAVVANNKKGYKN